MIAKTPEPKLRTAKRETMNTLLAFFVVSAVLLALDLWTAPKSDRAPRPHLKDSGPSA